MANPTIKEIEAYFQKLYKEYTNETTKITDLQCDKLLEMGSKISEKFGRIQWDEKNESRNRGKVRERQNPLLNVINDKKCNKI